MSAHQMYFIIVQIRVWNKRCQIGEIFVTILQGNLTSNRTELHGT